MDPRPVVHCLIGMRLPDGDYVVRRGDPLTLDEAVEFIRFGWECIPDPMDLEVLTRWEQLNRQPKPKWHRW